MTFSLEVSSVCATFILEGFSGASVDICIATLREKDREDGVKASENVKSAKAPIEVIFMFPYFNKVSISMSKRQAQMMDSDEWNFSRKMTMLHDTFYRTFHTTTDTEYRELRNGTSTHTESLISTFGNCIKKSWSEC